MTRATVRSSVIPVDSYHGLRQALCRGAVFSETHYQSATTRFKSSWSPRLGSLKADLDEFHRRHGNEALDSKSVRSVSLLAPNVRSDVDKIFIYTRKTEIIHATKVSGATGRLTRYQLLAE